MKRTLHLLLALMLLVGIANAQDAKKNVVKQNASSTSCISLDKATALGLEKKASKKSLQQKANTNKGNSRMAIMHDFEDGTFGPFNWTNSADYPWLVVNGNGGKIMLTSNAGVSSSESTISFAFTYDANGTISFDAECMGEGSTTAWDKCVFYIDDVAQFTYGAHVASQGFVNYSYDITPGNHVFKWSYTKDSSVNPTGDYFAVDNIAITIDDSPTLTPITSIAINGYESPVGGEDSQNHLNITVPTNANYHIYQASYSPGWWDNDADDDFYGTFVEGTNYSLGMTLEANSGYYFAEGCTFTVNGSNALVDYLYTSIDDEDNTLAYLWTVPEPASGSSAGGDIIDFETGDFSQYPFVNQSQYPWVIVDASNGCDNGTQYCAMSSNAGVSSSSSVLEATYTFAEDGYINFDAKCMGEGSTTAWDKCIFYIDDVAQFTYGAHVAEQGWVNYNYEVSAGTHTFKWEYSKDSSVNPTGDCFKVDNIAFGTGSACIAPTSVTATCPFNDATITWNGVADSYTLRYRVTGTTSWTTVNNITENTYVLSGLQENTSYDVEVAADCDSENIASVSFNTHEPLQSQALFYGYATYSLDDAEWNQNLITFNPLDPATVTAVSSEIPQTYAASYALGYMWLLTSVDGNTGDLMKVAIAPTGIVGTPELVVDGFDSSIAISMSYNNADGKMYYVTVNDNDIYELKQFDPTNTSASFTTIGAIEAGAQLFAINAQGQAYCISATDGNLYQVNLTDATTTLVGNTGKSLSYVQSMAFDMETGELFWAQLSSQTDCALYYVDTETGLASLLGPIGGGSGAEVTGMFMVWGDTPECDETTEVNVSDITGNSALITWNGNAESYTLRYRVHNPNAQGQVYDFEDGDPNWTMIDADGDGNNWYLLDCSEIEENYAHSGTNLMTSASYINNVGALTPDNWLVLPQYTVNEGDAVSFWVSGQDPSYAAEVYGVFVSTTTPDVSEFTAISDQLTATGTWEKKTFDLSAYAGQNVYVAIRHFNVTDMFRINIDDIEIGTPEYGEWVIIDGITENSYTLTGLTAGTTYEVEVSSFCSQVSTEFTSTDGIEEVETGISVWSRDNEIRIDLANSGNYTMNVVNILGQNVLTSDISGQGSHIVKHNLTAGIYVVTLSNSDNTFATKVVVK